jgi:hypothetical protein
MADKETTKTTTPEPEVGQGTATGPLVFISHDSRDAELAEAFSKLLKSVSGSMLKSFRSTDKKGKEGIEFGDEWFKRLTEQLKAASDVVCLFTERSLERPWILYEAGVARGTLKTPVLGLALGIPLSRVSTGPFYHFQNSDDTEELLTKLVRQLASRVPSLEPDDEVVSAQVKAFRATEQKLLQKMAVNGTKEEKPPEENLIAKFLEEMKGMVRELPSRISERMGEGGDPVRRRRLRRFHPMMFEEIMHMGVEPGDPIGILLLASLVRDDLPWFYEIALEAYHAIRVGDAAAAERELHRIEQMSEMMVHGPFSEGLGLGDKETHMLLREMPRLMHNLIRSSMEGKKPSRRRRMEPPESPQS